MATQCRTLNPKPTNPERNPSPDTNPRLDTLKTRDAREGMADLFGGLEFRTSDSGFMVHSARVGGFEL